jgi:hypothetical protein
VAFVPTPNVVLPEVATVILPVVVTVLLNTGVALVSRVKLLLAIACVTVKPLLGAYGGVCRRGALPAM